MFALVILFAVIAVAVVAVGAAGLAGRLPENRFVGVRTEQTLSDPLLWRTANRVAGPALIASGVIFFGGALAALALPGPWSYVLLAVVAVGGVLLAGFGALQGSRAASIQARMQMPEATCCSADDAPAGTDPADDCGVAGGCGACALKGMCDDEARTA